MRVLLYDIFIFLIVFVKLSTQRKYYEAFEGYKFRMTRKNIQIIDRPLLFGHRGFPEQFAESTMTGFKKALENGADFLEVDLVLTQE